MFHRFGEASPLLDLELSTPPTVSPIDLETAKAHLKVDDDDENDLIQTHIDAALAAVDGYAGDLGRCLVEQTWTLYLDGFPGCGCHHGDLPRHRPEIKLPLTPLIAVDSVTYLDPTGTPQTLNLAACVVRTGPRGEIALKRGQVWPQVNGDPRCVIIVFRAGWAAAKGDPPTPVASDVPANIRAAMLLIIGDLYENREAIVVAESRVTQILNPTADNLLARYRADFL